MKAIVTGGAGFIGGHLCHSLLADGHQVWAGDDLDPFYAPAIKRGTADVIVHLATRAGVRPSNAMGVEPVLPCMPPQPGDVERTCADREKAWRLLGYAPSGPIEARIPRFAEWFRAPLG